MNKEGGAQTLERGTETGVSESRVRERKEPRLLTGVGLGFFPHL